MTKDNLAKLNSNVTVMFGWLIALAIIMLLAAAATSQVALLCDAVVYGACAIFIRLYKSRVAGVIATSSFFIGKIATAQTLVANPIAMLVAIVAAFFLVRGTIALFKLANDGVIEDVECEEVEDSTKE